MKRGDIYLASYHFPHENGTVVRQRPVLVLQCDEDNENSYYPLVIVAPVFATLNSLLRKPPDKKNRTYLRTGRFPREG